MTKSAWVEQTLNPEITVLFTAVCILKLWPEATAGQGEETQQGQQHPEGQKGEDVQKGVGTQEEAEDHQLEQ